MILLDTHIWLWWLLGDGNLTGAERSALDSLASQQELAISWVSVWETEMLERKGRVKLLPDITTWLNFATKPEICRILPVDTQLVLAQRNLPKLFNNDPADRLITCSAILANIPLATKDRNIVESGACSIWEIE